MSLEEVQIDSSNSPRSTVISKSVESMNSNGVGVDGAANGSVGKTVPGKESPVADNNGTAETEPKKTPEGRSTPTDAPSVAAPQPYYQAGYEPPSPATGIAIGAYDPASFFQQTGFMPHSGSFGGPNTPLSPPRPAVGMGGIPPASPLFPRTASGGAHGNPALEPRQGGPPPSPVPYVSPHLGPNMYPTYAAATNLNGTSLSEEQGQQGWMENVGSPQLNPQGAVAMSYGFPTRAASGGRAYSFDEMLPPAAMSEQHDIANPAYSPYNGSQPSPGGGTMLVQNSQWQYGAPPDMYSTPGSPLQPRAGSGMPMPYGAMQQGGRQMANYGQYYAASSPGPPIQTTASNKGPDGANLFIFHIPNHFTNLDMYQLFCPYGHLLSVRIMVEKESGRSRGFGFVSYDSPAAAAAAIKQLNGFAIGNKRLKVQHKQIRQNDRESSHTPGAPPGTYAGAVGNDELGLANFPSSLPPSGSDTNEHLWYPENGEVAAGEVGAVEEALPVDTAAVSTATEPSMGLPGVESTSPLATLGSLKGALPEMPGEVGSG